MFCRSYLWFCKKLFQNIIVRIEFPVLCLLTRKRVIFPGEFVLYFGGWRFNLFFHNKTVKKSSLYRNGTSYVTRPEGFCPTLNFPIQFNGKSDRRALERLAIPLMMSLKSLAYANGAFYPVSFFLGKVRITFQETTKTVSDL